ncbi:hypothetical protein LTR36_004254 [Oleoguttula mirabilis]|uniref:Uncharacterized protein n=1 Tax=Oleoguttula mirabilis TaxID=1507867 RepID=A0AAV9JHC8_9PEZI|nr:hypothetical protein LTR36_004254 [Oleoguttula mirabilis]
MLALATACKQLRNEAGAFFYGYNAFNVPSASRPRYTLRDDIAIATAEKLAPLRLFVAGSGPRNANALSNVTVDLGRFLTCTLLWTSLDVIAIRVLQTLAADMARKPRCRLTAQIRFGALLFGGVRELFEAEIGVLTWARSLVSWPKCLGS